MNGFLLLHLVNNQMILLSVITDIQLVMSCLKVNFCQFSILGWVPISIDCKQYVWHHQVVENDRVLVIQTSGDELELVDLKLCDLKGKTFELIGTNVNGNPYS